MGKESFEKKLSKLRGKDFHKDITRLMTKYPKGVKKKSPMFPGFPKGKKPFSMKERDALIRLMTF